MVEFVHFAGCPNADAARQVLRSALRAAGRAENWTEWDLLSSETPDSVRGYASPSILVNGVDVAGASPMAGGIACKSGSIPTTKMIQRALKSDRNTLTS
jgi:hypothetical protein